MEAQPFVLALLFGSLFFTGQSDVFPLVDGSIMLLVLSLYWWAMLVKRVIQPRLGEKWANLVYFPGLFITFAVIVGTHTSFLDDVPQIVFSAALSLWLWWRGMVRIEKGLQEEQLTTSFQVGFFVLLAALLFAVIFPKPSHLVMFHVLTYALPIFFLSGLIALSLSRLDMIKRTYVHRSPGRLQADPTRMWLSMLLLLVAVIAVSTIMAAFAFQPFLTVLSPLVNAVQAFFSWLLSFFASQPPPATHPRKTPSPGVSIPINHLKPYHNSYAAILQLMLVIVLVLLAIFVLVMLLLIIREISRKWKRASDADEVRESLSVRSILRARRKQRQKRPGVTLEQLDPASTRARYREFLQMMAQQGNNLGRYPNETPSEYQTRLLTLVENVPHDEAEKSGTLADTALLDELTRAYTLERYGGKRTANSQQAYFHRWVSRLVKRLISSKST